MAIEHEEWSQYRMLIVTELERLSKGIDTLRERLEDLERERRREVSVLQTEIALLKLKAGVWGLIGGAIPVAIALAAQWLNLGGQ